MSILAEKHYKESNITDKQIDDEGSHHMYIKIGEYYIFALVLSSPFFPNTM